MQKNSSMLGLILGLVIAHSAIAADELPEQPTEAVASISQLELLLTESLCGQASIQQQWGMDKVGCMQHLFDQNIVSVCTTANMAKVPASDNLPDGARLTMASFSTVYVQCLIEGHSTPT